MMHQHKRITIQLYEHIYIYKGTQIQLCVATSVNSVLCLEIICTLAAAKER